MTSMYSEEARSQLEILQKDFTTATGNPFKYFYCPILHRDEDTELCMGHIVNAAIPNSCRSKIVQRKDIDGLFGAVFESEFTLLLEAQSRSLKDVVFDPDLRKKMKPRLVIDGEDCKYYAFRGHKAENHAGLVLEKGDGGNPIKLVLEKNRNDVLANLGKNWNFVVERDCRVSAVATLIKSAYLTMFRLLGYRYALSAGGVEVGHGILGGFFREFRNDPARAKIEAPNYFRPYVNIMRPIDSFSARAPLGTIEDNVAMVCFGSSGKPFAMVVFVRTNKLIQAVLLPAYDNPESAAAYFDFLANDNETLQATYCQFNQNDGCWHGNSEPIQSIWPKQHESFKLV